MQSSLVSGVLMTVAREFYNERRGYIIQLQAHRVFPLSIANQGTTYARRARIINLFGPHIYCVLMHLR